MNFLPSIEVLSFLDWLDKEAIFNEMYDTSIEEFILDSQHDNQLMDLIDRYKGNRKNYEKTYEGSFERELDGFLQNLKMETMLEYKRVFGESDYMRAGDWMYDRFYSNVLRKAEEIITERRWMGRERIEDISSISTNELLY